MKNEFSDLGIPFPLFEGLIENVSEYIGENRCCVCKQEKQFCFELGIGCDLIVRCTRCGTENDLDADDREEKKCRKCRGMIEFPVEDEYETHICYDCWRAGKAAITKDTRLGMITWNETIDGVTHGVPGLKDSNYELVLKEDDWVGARIGSAVMFELLRTPTYNTIQGESWEFCCKKPMIFLGEWSKDDFMENSPDGDGRKYFDQIISDSCDVLWEDSLHDVTGIYVFRCQECTRVTGNWDIA